MNKVQLRAYTVPVRDYLKKRYVEMKNKQDIQSSEKCPDIGLVRVTVKFVGRMEGSIRKVGVVIITNRGNTRQ